MPFGLCHELLGPLFVLDVPQRLLVWGLLKRWRALFVIVALGALLCLKAPVGGGIWPATGRGRRVHADLTVLTLCFTSSAGNTLLLLPISPSPFSCTHTGTVVCVWTSSLPAAGSSAAEWADVAVPLQRACDGDLTQPFILSVWDHQWVRDSLLFALACLHCTPCLHSTFC